MNAPMRREMVVGSEVKRAVTTGSVLSETIENARQIIASCEAQADEIRQSLEVIEALGYKEEDAVILAYELGLLERDQVMHPSAVILKLGDVLLGSLERLDKAHSASNEAS